MSRHLQGNVKAYVGNRHLLGFYAQFQAGVTAPGDPEYRESTASPYEGPVGVSAMAAQIAADPEFMEWAAEERAANLGMLMRRANR
jgi:hypothetical protein